MLSVHLVHLQKLARVLENPSMIVAIRAGKRSWRRRISRFRRLSDAMLIFGGLDSHSILKPVDLHAVVFGLVVLRKSEDSVSVCDS
jgi:hypothetical protein